ncbi:hypothetical protein C8J57DRAFT_1238487 [Mycena rebaudengoi]|nr:hypothetical protein C8J57DRAFT_1238487 [Mycena rebaudengoi]
MAYDRCQLYLTEGQDTPMACVYNASALIRTLRGEEFTDSNSHMTDARGHELAFNSELVTLRAMQDVYNGLTKEYHKILEQEIFFGEPIPPDFSQGTTSPVYLKTRETKQPAIRSYLLYSHEQGGLMFLMSHEDIILLQGYEVIRSFPSIHSIEITRANLQFAATSSGLFATCRHRCAGALAQLHLNGIFFLFFLHPAFILR